MLQHRLFLGMAALPLLLLISVQADVSQLVRSGNGFVYDVPKVTELELEINNEFPTGVEFPQNVIPAAPSDAQLGVAEPAEEYLPPKKHSPHGYDYQVPSRRFKS